jgi:uncharacterized membrane protein YkoI
MTKQKIVSKNVLLCGAIVVAAVVLMTAAVISEVIAQTTSSAAFKNATTATTTNPNQRNLPNAALANITGSIPLRSTISSAIFSKVKINLSDAIAIAQKAVGSNTSASLAFIRPLNGYLVYDVHVRNNNNNTTTAVIVDAGNGKVLYKQSPPSLAFGDFGFGHYGMFGQGKMRPFFGGHGPGGGRGGFGDHGSGMTMGPQHMGPRGSVPTG